MPFTNISGAPGNAAINNVAWGLGTSASYANGAYNQAISFANGLAGLAGTVAALPTISTTVAAPSQVLTPYAAPTAPTDITVTFNAPAAPTEPAFASVDPMQIGSAPEFSETAPALVYPDAPAVLNASLPSAPTLSDVAVPDAPTVTLPDVPTLTGIEIPAAPQLALTPFDYAPPEGPAYIERNFSFVEPGYSSTLLDSMKSTLQTWIVGTTTGLPKEVEDAIWERARAREMVNARRQMEEVTRGFASRGFARPPGAMALAMQQALKDAQDKVSTLSRDVAIKQAELEQENRKFAFDTAFKVESELIQYENLVAQRAFEAAKYTQEVALQVYQYAVSKYQADIAAYGARIEGFKTSMQVELNKLEEYKARIQAQALVGTINEQAINIYRARVESVKSLIDVFTAQVNAANAQVMVNKGKIDNFGAQVSAYGEQVRAKASEYDGYATRIKAEATKIDAYRTSADAYRSRIEGFKTLVDARVQAKNMEIKTGVEIPMDLFKMRSAVYKDLVGAEAVRLGAITDVQDSKVKTYAAKVQGEAARVAGETTAYSAQAQVNIGSASINVEALKANLTALIQKNNLLIEAVKSGAQVSSQLAAAALSSIHVQASVSSSYNESQSASDQYSASYSGTIA